MSNWIPSKRGGKTEIINKEEGEEEDKEGGKIMAITFPNLIKMINSQKKISSINTKLNEHKENHLKAYYNQIARN